MERFIFLLLTLAIPSFACAGENEAYQYIQQVFDQYHRVFYIYRDADSGGNKFIPSGWMGDRDDIIFEADSSNSPHSGSTCIQITYLARGRGGNRWAGIYWQFPENNWGKSPGLDLRGAKTFTFWARGEKGGEKAEFKVGGIGSSKLRTTGEINLGRQWDKYQIPLDGLELKNLIGGFCWVTNTSQNPQGATIYIDEIYFELERPNELRFLQSYEVTSAPEDTYLRNSAFTYDNALALLAFLARGEAKDLQKAKLLADSFLFAQNHDRYFSDGRLRNAYQSGDLKDPVTGKARLPGWWDKKKGTWFEDKYQVGTHTGNLAWVMIALLEAHKRFGDERYLKSVLRLAHWIENNCHDTRGKGGYAAGFEGWEGKQEKKLWKSTEHNIDLYVAFERLHDAAADHRWRKASDHAWRFVLSMWDEEGGHFWSGTLEDGKTLNKQSIPLDVQTWAILAMKENRFARAMDWAEKHCFVSSCPKGCPASGFDFNEDRDGIWYEGTAQAALVYELLGRKNKSEDLILSLRKAQSPSGGLYAACHDRLSTGFDWNYYHRPHIGATCWYILAERGINLFWGDGIPRK